MAKIYKLNSKKSLALQALRLSGWYENREVDTQGFSYYYERNNLKYNEYADRFFKEFYGLKGAWYFKWIDTAGQEHIGGYDFEFDTGYYLDDTYDDTFDLEDERELLPSYIKDTALPLAYTAWHVEGTLWIDERGKFYYTFPCNDMMREYNSCLEFLEDMIKFPSDEVYLTFEHGGKNQFVGEYEVIE